MSGPVPIEVIVGGLSDRIAELCRELLPLGRREGSEWVEAKRKHGGLGDGLRVSLAQGKRGIWSHFGDAGPLARGDALDLVAYMVTNGDKGEALKWSRRWLGIDNLDPRELEQRRQAAARKAERERQADVERKRARRERAIRYWNEAEASLKGTPAEFYLRGRGIYLDRLGRQPRSLRFHPGLVAGKADDGTWLRFPALIGLILKPGGRIAGIHRIWLDRDAAGKWTKAPLDPPRKALGEHKGGAIRIWRGADGKSLAEAAPGSAVAIVEGVEDALALACGAPDLRILCGISLSNMANVELPETIGTVYLGGENDDNDTARAAFARAAEAHMRQGRRVFDLRPPEGFKDINDLLQRGQPA